jgi:hypothetical protein
VTFIARLDMAYPLKLAMEYDGRDIPLLQNFGAIEFTTPP